MPHFPHTPEALLGRNDSKNASTTCRGITASGRPCRRALASTKLALGPLKGPASFTPDRVVALVHEQGQLQEIDFYCWQHKAQAERKVECVTRNEADNPNGRSARLHILRNRDSVDTLVQRLGIDVPENLNVQVSGRTHNPRPPKSTQVNDFAAESSRRRRDGEKNHGLSRERKTAHPEKNGFWASLCCMSVDDDDYVEIVRHRKRAAQARDHQRGPLTLQSPTSAAAPKRMERREGPSDAIRPINESANRQLHSKPKRHSTSNPQTERLLSLIPAHLAPQTTAALLSELIKPISPADEAGYIYIFWLTPQSRRSPPRSTALSLLSPDRPDHARRISDVMSDFSCSGDDDHNGASATDPPTRAQQQPPPPPPTILLKIGRANNITRRMNEWQRQCGYALNLVRWYPYIPSSTAPAPLTEPLYPDLTRPPPPGARRSSGSGGGDVTVRKVSCVKRVERLIHLELAAQQVRRLCSACGKEHREWFEVGATQAGVRAVDETVRRWVRWAEGMAGSFG